MINLDNCNKEYVRKDLGLRRMTDKTDSVLALAEEADA